MAPPRNKRGGTRFERIRVNEDARVNDWDLKDVFECDCRFLQYRFSEFLRW